MSIVRKVKAVERVFKSLDDEINLLKKETKLYCFSGCGMCCTKPDIEASPLEFLPLAFKWFKEGYAHEKYKAIRNERSQVCLNYFPLSIDNHFHGNCSNYAERALVCRLFGYGATRDKNGDHKFVTCKLIKEDQPESFTYASQLAQRKEKVPVFSDYYKRLYQIDFRLANQILPINKAILIALEEVLHYFAYRPYTSTKRTG